MQNAHVPQVVRPWGGRLVGVALLSSTVLACGCSSMSNTDRGALTGGAIGTGVGAAIGSVTHHTAAGAAIGAITGLAAGALVGNGIDEKQKREAAERYAAEHPPLTLQEVATMSQQGVGDEVIITKLRSSPAVYNLTADQIIWLKQSGVHECVIQEMQMTNGYPRRVYAAAPVYVVEPEPPPVAIGIGFRGSFR
jgi:outer membrane lipoprotein SlyB